ncbi:MAG: hypothetical protein U5L76_00565 [Patescibacteria group bacterium]|nr:hypothetical protein [Patescibacteria group bacterium]
MNQKGLTTILILGLIVAVLIAGLSFGYVKYIKNGNDNTNIVSNKNTNLNTNVAINSNENENINSVTDKNENLNTNKAVNLNENENTNLNANTAVNLNKNENTNTVVVVNKNLNTNSSAEDNDNWVSYVNEKLNIQLEYPKEISNIIRDNQTNKYSDQIVTTIQTSDYQTNETPLNLEIIKGIQFNITQGTPSWNSAVGGVNFEGLKNWLDLGRGGTAPSVEEEITVCDENAIYHLGNYSSGGKFEHAYFLHHSKLYNLSVSLADNKVLILKNILSTLEFTK